MSYLHGVLCPASATTRSCNKMIYIHLRKKIRYHLDFFVFITFAFCEKIQKYAVLNNAGFSEFSNWPSFHNLLVFSLLGPTEELPIYLFFLVWPSANFHLPATSFHSYGTPATKPVSMGVDMCFHWDMKWSSHFFLNCWSFWTNNILKEITIHLLPYTWANRVPWLTNDWQ